MKINGVIIQDTKSEKVFGFVQQFPGVCAQGDTIVEVQQKIDKYFESFIERMGKQQVEYSEPQAL